MTIELPARMIGSLPANKDTEAALDFLTRPDLTRIAPREVGFGPAEASLRICRIGQQITAEAGAITYGFPSLLSALGELHPKDLVTSTAFVTAGTAPSC